MTLDQPLADLAQAFESETEGAEAIHQLCVMPFRSLLHAPLGPTIDNVCQIDGADVGANLQLDAAGVHTAGRRLPRGRHSELFVASDAILRSLRGHNAHPSSSSALFLATFHNVHALLFGRHQTFLHALLHSQRTSGLIIEIPLTGSAPAASAKRSEPTGYTFERLQFPSDVLPYLADATVRRKLSILTWANSSLGQGGSDAKPELAALRAQRVVEQLKTERDTAAQWYCMYHTLLKNTDKAVAVLEEKDSDDILHQLHRLIADPYLHPEARSNASHLRTVAIERAVRMLQLFFLYREFCGEWFYVIAPPDQRDLRMCFTLGTRRPLAASELNALAELARSVRNRARGYLSELGGSLTAIDIGTQRNATRRLLKTTFSALATTGLTFDARVPPAEGDDKTPTAAGLPAYLAFCERVAEQAVHEGKKLHFDIVVCDGFFASERLTRLSALPGGKDRTTLEWPVARVSDDVFQAEEQYISRLLGNYAFMQSQNVVLQGTREGRLLCLASVLPGFTTPEHLTESSDAYLIRVVENGDICVYARGNLALWRRSGEYIVPRLYGRAYRQELAGWLARQFPACHSDVDFEVIADMIWAISADRRGGCTLVLGRMSGGSFPIGERSYPLTDVFPFANGVPLATREGATLLQQLAVQDGATIIDVDTGAVFGRRQLAPPPLDWGGESKHWGASGDGRWEEWHKVLRWGTRHHSALALSAGAGDAGAVVITVSSDADIHVFRGRRPEAELTYPRAVRDN